MNKTVFFASCTHLSEGSDTPTHYVAHEQEGKTVPWQSLLCTGLALLTNKQHLEILLQSSMTRNMQYLSKAYVQSVFVWG